MLPPESADPAITTTSRESQTSNEEDLSRTPSGATEIGWFTATLRRLPSVQKSAKGAPAYSRFVNRRAGGYLAVVGYRLGMTPNQMTAVSALCTFAAITAIATVPPSIPLGLAVCAGLVVGYALDSADGQLARLRGGGSTAGEWLDHVVDSAKIVSLHVAVLISGFRFWELPPAGLLVPLGFAVVGTVLFFAMILNDQMRRRARGPGQRVASGETPSLLRSLLVVPTDYGLLCLAFALLGTGEIFAAAYALLFAGHLAFTIAALPKWFREMGRLGHKTDQLDGNTDQLDSTTAQEGA